MASSNVPSAQQPFVPPADSSPAGAVPSCSPNDCASAPASGMASANQPPIACDLSVFTPTERRAHIALYDQVVLGQAHSIHELSDGYSYYYTYPADSDLLAKLSHWIGGERKCCPFLKFGLELEPLGGALVLRLWGPEGVKALLASELEARGALTRVQ